MSQNTQEYLNNLINKSRIYYLDLNNSTKRQNHDCSTCRQRVNSFCKNCDTERQLEGEITDLSQFDNLKGINISNNTFTNLNFLDTLSNKDKLKSINLFGNQIKEIDFADLFTKFPNLEKIYLQNNPTSAKNLDHLTSEQFRKLIQSIKEQKIKVDSFKGTILIDLLEHTQKPTTQENNQEQQQNAKFLQTLISSNSPTKSDDKQPNNNSLSLLIGGFVLFGISLLGIGYLWGKKRKNSLDDE